MKLTNAIKKAEKIARQTIQTNDVNLFWVEYKGYTVSFYPNGHINENTNATCFYATKKARTENDYNSDYWPGTFYDNLSQCFRSIDRG